MAVNPLLGVLQQAMLSERDGYQFYVMAARQADDAGATDVFTHLAEEEMAHYKALQDTYRSLLDTGEWNAELAWGDPELASEPGGIFSADFVRRIRGKHLEMAALSIGILLEKQSFEFYSKQSAASDDASVREFFAKLAAWENSHYQMLLREDEALKEEYWSENRFEPLL